MVAEQSTDGITGVEAAKKFLDGDLPKPKDGYDGFQHGSTSLVNDADIPLEEGLGIVTVQGNNPKKNKR